MLHVPAFNLYFPHCENLKCIKLHHTHTLIEIECKLNRIHLNCGEQMHMHTLENDLIDFPFVNVKPLVLGLRMRRAKILNRTNDFDTIWFSSADNWATIIGLCVCVCLQQPFFIHRQSFHPHKSKYACHGKRRAPEMRQKWNSTGANNEACTCEE